MPDRKPLSEAITIVIHAKRAANLRPTYIRGLDRYLRQFATWFGPERPIDEITVESIEDWFAKRGEKPRTMASNIGRLGSLLGFAYRRRWISHNPIDQLERPRLDARTPRILTPDECRTLLSVCWQRWPRFIPPLALMLFGGVRPYEVSRLAWSNVDLEHGVVRIDGAVSKVRARRIVRIRPVLAEWLRLGGDLPCASHRRHVRRLAKAIGWWEQDVLRHTAASYMLAADMDTGRVSTELGNSPGILMRHYVGLVSPADAARFWALIPKSTQ